MSGTAPEQWTDTSREAVFSQLNRILSSGVFKTSTRRQRFLQYIVTETLAGRGQRLKGYSIGIEVFERPVNFDAAVDPVVRIEAGRLRDKLREYYDGEGRGDPVRIDLPKGSYTPVIQLAGGGAEGKSNEITGETVGEVPPSDRILPPAPATSRNNSRELLVALFSGAAILLAAIAYWLAGSSPTARTDKASIAILPFSNIGSDPQWTRFADGVTEDIITDLSHSKDLFVVARNSSEAYRGKAFDVRDVGRELGVRYVLEGSIQPSDGQIRVTAQLIDARSGGHVWANRYDRPATDLFAVQRDVTEKIAATLLGYEGAVAQAERAFIKRKAPNNLTAYEHYLLGLEAKHSGAVGAPTREGLEQAERLFKKALVLDPQLARAYVGIAYVYEYRLDFGFGDSQENLTRQMEAAQNGVRLDPNDGETQLVLGHAYAYRGMVEQALEQFSKAETLAPNNADVLILIAWYLPQLNQPARASQLAERALSLNPNYASWYNQGLRLIYFFDRKFEKSIRYAKLVSQPQALDFAYLAAAYAMLNNSREAQAAAANVAKLDPDWSLEKYISDNGGFPDALADLFAEAATKAGLKTCLAPTERTSILGLIPMKYCDKLRAQSATKH